MRLGFRLTASDSPILPILIGDADRAVSLAHKLLTYGVYAPAIRPPTVPPATSRIRLTITADHTTEHIDEALTALEQAGRSAPPDLIRDRLLTPGQIPRNRHHFQRLFWVFSCFPAFLWHDSRISTCHAHLLITTLVYPHILLLFME